MLEKNLVRRQILTRVAILTARVTVKPKKYDYEILKVVASIGSRWNTAELFAPKVMGAVELQASKTRLDH